MKYSIFFFKYIFQNLKESNFLFNEFKFKRGIDEAIICHLFFFFIFVEGLNVLMKSSIEAGLFIGYSVGCSGSISVSHLQFAHDTFLLGVKRWANV